MATVQTKLTFNLHSTTDLKAIRTEAAPEKIIYEIYDCTVFVEEHAFDSTSWFYVQTASVENHSFADKGVGFFAVRVSFVAKTYQTRFVFSSL